MARSLDSPRSNAMRVVVFGGRQFGSDVQTHVCEGVPRGPECNVSMQNRSDSSNSIRAIASAEDISKALRGVTRFRATLAVRSGGHSPNPSNSSPPIFTAGPHDQHRELHVNSNTYYAELIKNRLVPLVVFFIRKS